MDSKELINGVKIPQLGLGMFRIQDGDLVIKTVKAGFQAGYRHIDTAAAYTNEASVGKAIVESGISREEIFLTTKISNDEQRNGNIREAFDRSLEKLQTRYVDLYLIHWPVPGYFVNTWKEIEKIYAEKKARAIGVSNFRICDLMLLEENSELAPMVNQVEIHPYFQQEELVNYCQSRNILMEAWSPFTRGLTDLLHDRRLEKIGEKYHKSIAQAVLRWNIQRDIVPLPKSTDPVHQKSNIDIFDFTLDDDDMKEFKSFDRGQRVGLSPDNINF